MTAAIDQHQRRADVDADIWRAANVAAGEYLTGRPHMRRWSDDILSDACLGAARAERTWNPDKGASLFTHALRRARGAILDGLRHRSPATRGEHARGVTAATLPPHRQPSVPLELCAELLDGPATDFADHLLDQLAIAAVIDQWPARDRFILRAISGGETRVWVAAQLGLSETRVGQLYRQACRTLAAALTDPATGRPA